MGKSRHELRTEESEGEYLWCTDYTHTNDNKFLFAESRGPTFYIARLNLTFNFNETKHEAMFVLSQQAKKCCHYQVNVMGQDHVLTALLWNTVTLTLGPTPT